MKSPSRRSSTRTLTEFGLSENESVLYELMLTRPQSTAIELGSVSPFPRTMLYYVLKQLMRRGLVRSTKEGWRTVYAAEDPEHLYDLLSKKQREFEKQTDAVRDLIPRLKRTYRLAGVRPVVRTFEGTEEYRRALEDIIVSAPATVLSYEALGKKRAALEVRDAHERRRIARKIQRRVMFFESAKALSYLSKRGYDDFTQFRSVRNGTVSPFETDVTIYDGKVLYTSYDDSHEPTAILVEDMSLFTMQKNLFEQLWKTGTDHTLAATRQS